MDYQSNGKMDTSTEYIHGHTLEHYAHVMNVMRYEGPDKFIGQNIIHIHMDEVFSVMN